MANKITDMGIVRPLDSIGRLMIPIEARRELGITPGDKVHIYLDNGKVVVEKYKRTCYICGQNCSSFSIVKDKRICENCRRDIIGTTTLADDPNAEKD